MEISYSNGKADWFCAVNGYYIIMPLHLTVLHIMDLASPAVPGDGNWTRLLTHASLFCYACLLMLLFRIQALTGSQNLLMIHITLNGHLRYLCSTFCSLSGGSFFTHCPHKGKWHSTISSPFPVIYTRTGGSKKTAEGQNSEAIWKECIFSNHKGRKPCLT